MCSIFTLECALPAHCVVDYRKLLDFLGREIRKMVISVYYIPKALERPASVVSESERRCKLGEAMSKGDYAS